MSRRKSGHDIHGILLLDKRLGISSNQALQEVKGLFKANKAGHTGSLDPLATGLLPVCFGEATKISTFLLDNDKRYRVVVHLGVTTDTGDAEGKILDTRPVPELKPAQLVEVLNKFIGVIDQIPPMYSALKYQGKKLYEFARAGHTVIRKSRRISIYKLKLLNFSGDLLTLDVHCSKGTYIRTLAEDIGQQLGCGGSVQELRRLEVGQFEIADARTYDQLLNIEREEQLLKCLLAVDKPLSLIAPVKLSDEQALQIKQGQRLKFDNAAQGVVRMYSSKGFLGLGEMLLDGKLAPKKLFNIF